MFSIHRLDLAFLGKVTRFEFKTLIMGFRYNCDAFPSLKAVFLLFFFAFFSVVSALDDVEYRGKKKTFHVASFVGEKKMRTKKLFFFGSMLSENTVN